MYLIAGELQKSPRNCRKIVGIDKEWRKLPRKCRKIARIAEELLRKCEKIAEEWSKNGKITLKKLDSKNVPIRCTSMFIK